MVVGFDRFGDCVALVPLADETDRSGNFACRVDRYVDSESDNLLLERLGWQNSPQHLVRHDYKQEAQKNHRRCASGDTGLQTVD